MTFLESNLTKDEKVVASIKHSWAGLVGAFIVLIVNTGLGIVICFIKSIIARIGEAINEPFEVTTTSQEMLFIFFYVFGVLFILLGIFYFVNAIVEIKSAQLVVTNKRILGRRGLISKMTTDVLLNKVDTVNVSNGIFGAIFHYGTVQIVSPASGFTNKQQRATLQYGYIINTMEFRKAVLDAIEQVKQDERNAQAEMIAKATAANGKD